MSPNWIYRTLPFARDFKILNFLNFLKSLKPERYLWIGFENSSKKIQNFKNLENKLKHHIKNFKHKDIQKKNIALLVIRNPFLWIGFFGWHNSPNSQNTNWGFVTTFGFVSIERGGGRCVNQLFPFLRAGSLHWIAYLY